MQLIRDRSPSNTEKRLKPKTTLYILPNKYYTNPYLWGQKRVLMKLVFSTICILLFSNLSGQFAHEAVHEGQEGEVLKSLVIESYRPNVVLSYGEARDTMYGIIDNVQDTVSGIYSDHKVYLKPGEDPSIYIFKDGTPNGINAEHSYPQSKGAGNGNPRSDMHHLFPSRVGTNSARGSLPFAEINDNITNIWFYKTQENSNKPNVSQIDRYSEKGNERWEPRETVKGDIARAIMYFFTMYEAQAMNADPTFFEGMRETLCMWHELDPVDEKEWNRTKMIAKWQEGKANPFVLDCTLASRIYCDGPSLACLIVDVPLATIESIRLVENPVQTEARFTGFIEGKTYAYEVLDMYGQQIMSGTNQNNSSSLLLNLDFLGSGAYIVRWILPEEGTSKSFMLLKI